MTNLEVLSADGTRIHAEVSGRGTTALVFVHGWLGNGRWWHAQRDALAGEHTIVQLDLPGHGRSGSDRVAWSIDGFADDIVAVAAQVEAERVVLIGHSMSGAHATVAASRMPTVAMLVLVDTLKQVEHVMPREEVDAMLAVYRRDFRAAVEQILPRYLYAPATPPEVIARLAAEFLAHPVELAIAILEPLYRDDYRTAARQLRVPVRAINGDLHPTDVTGNRAWFADYDVRFMRDVGHYPMLERPDEFTAELRAVLAELG
jgi:pimeloyl-ACP methyl ester carboxylesterase